MGKLQLVMVVHCHQPIGNFEAVCERAFQSCYQPFLEMLEIHPGVRMGLHYSGALLEWIEKSHPDFVERLTELCARGQVELLGGGFYEPILCLVPEIDALGQIQKMQEYIDTRLKVCPKGLWLAERVWEPGLTDLLSVSGLRYTLLDDTLFLYSGMPRNQLTGYYVTERLGRTLAVFPIDRDLRRAIPYQPVSEIVEEFKKQAEIRPRCITYGDDGEKFGLWPGSYELAYAQGWLQEFFDALESNTDWLETLPPEEYLNRFPPSGRIYLPNSSYEELNTWALPSDTQIDFEELKAKLKDVGLASEAESFCQRGMFQNFLVKYPEANHLHKKMLHISGKFNQALNDGEQWTDEHEQARLALYRGQCGSAYWHGVFGGIYLPHLRDAAYRELIKAEGILDRRAQGEVDWLSFDQRDFDADMLDEVLIESAWLNAYFDPAEGGALTELDFRPRNLNLTNVLARRPEAYHRRPKAGAEPSEVPGAYALDLTRRTSFLDRFPSVDTQLDALQCGDYHEEGDFLTGAYAIARLDEDSSGQADCELVMTRLGSLRRNDANLALEIEKRFRFMADRAELLAEYTLRNPGQQPLDLCFCPELNLTWLADEGMSDRYWIAFADGTFEAAGQAKTSTETDVVQLADRVDGVTIKLGLDPAAVVWRYPIVTSSQSEKGLTRIQQGLALLARYELTIPPGASVRISIRLSATSNETAQPSAVELGAGPLAP
jgi:hypothetical protein